MLGAARWRNRQQGKRLLFVNKKKQKSFSPFGPDVWRRGSLRVDTCKETKVFLVLFFQKKNRFLPLALLFDLSNEWRSTLPARSQCQVGQAMSPPLL
jgi:hypothetical protein